VIYAKPGEVFTAILIEAPTGLVGTIGVRIDSADEEDEIVARTTSGISEVPAGSGTYTVSLVAPSLEASYLITWDTVPGGEPLTPEKVGVEQLQVTRVAPFDLVVAFLPDPADVSALLPARTYVDDGGEVGSFTSETRPTAGQVQTLINSAGNEVAARLGQEVTDDTQRAYARELIAIRAAMGVEIGYFPEQTNVDESAYDKLKELYDEGLPALISSLPDSSSSKKGFYSLRTRSDVAGVFSTSELLP
jgi:hypothetical protein